MKLPNCLSPSVKSWSSSSSSFIVIFTLVSLIELAHATLSNQQEPIAANEIPTSKTKQVAAILAQDTVASSEFSQYSRDVTNLRLMPDLRSIKLRWTYEHSDANQPDLFNIRYCELTSWMAEIKCRQKQISPQRVADDELKTTTPLKQQHLLPANDVAAAISSPNGHAADDDSNSTVITKATNSVAVAAAAAAAAAHQTQRSSLSAQPSLVAEKFEAQIYDLRALTNYTFHVHVARFLGESATNSTTNNSRTPTTIIKQQQQQQRPSRRLDLLVDKAANSATAETRGRVETTKPFSAEAVKCLADSSEVLVNTGRYFGGRISVENQPDTRCQLLGNKSSEQTVYSFHIDHAACRSKILDGERIETMILVQENRDILTHNTARFLVQCNIGQKSFTVKASISLPKVMNGFNGQPRQSQSQIQTRPAMITPLASRPAPMWRAAAAGANVAEETNFDRVQLGTMPGIYRLIRAESSPSASLSQPQPQTQPQPQALIAAATSSSTATQSTTLAEATTTQQTATREAAAAAASEPVASSTMASSDTSQAIVLRPTPTTVHTSAPTFAPVARSQRQSKELMTDSGNLPLLPHPVEVSSRILFVERATDSNDANDSALSQREARLLLTNGGGSSGSNGDARGKSNAVNLLVRKQQSPTTLVNNTLNGINQLRTTSTSNTPLPSVGGDKSATISSFEQRSHRLQQVQSAETQRDYQDAPVIMTNNHRVVGNFMSLANQQPASLQAQVKRSNGERTAETSGGDFSIRYSANKVDEYSLDRLQPDDLALSSSANPIKSMSQTSGQTPRSRSGRMRHIGTSTNANQTQSSGLESRMGEVMQVTAASSSSQGDDFLMTPEASSRSENVLLMPAGANLTTSGQQNNVTHVQHNASLAHNITGALIRWSLKTLGNLARKSLESLVTDADNNNNNRDDDHTQKEGKTAPLDQRMTTESLHLQLPTTSGVRSSSMGKIKSTSAPGWQQEQATATSGSRARDQSTLTKVDGFLVNQRTSETLEAPNARDKLRAQRLPTIQVAAPSSQQQQQSPKEVLSEQQMRQARQQRLESTSSKVSQQTPSPPPPPSTPEQRISVIKSSRVKKNELQREKDELDANSDRYANDSTDQKRTLWPIYGLWALCALVALIMIAIYFVLMSPMQSNNSNFFHQQNIATATTDYRHQNGATTTKSPKLDFFARLHEAMNRNNQPPATISSALSSSSGMSTNRSIGQSTEILTAISRPKSFFSTQAQVVAASHTAGNFAENNAPTRSLVANSTSPIGSASTRSTSAASSSSSSPSGRENYCKDRDQYVVYTDYLVLTDDNSSVVDDHECLTRSAKRREPGESFA